MTIKKSPVLPLFNFFSSPNSWQLLIYFLSIILPFLGYHIHRIIQNVALSDWLLTLSKKFKIHSFCHNHSVFITKNNEEVKESRFT